MLTIISLTRFSVTFPYLMNGLFKEEEAKSIRIKLLEYKSIHAEKKIIFRRIPGVHSSDYCELMDDTGPLKVNV